MKMALKPCNKAYFKIVTKAGITSLFFIANFQCNVFLSWIS